MELKNQYLYAWLYKGLYKKQFSFEQSHSAVSLLTEERFYRLSFCPPLTFAMGF